MAANETRILLEPKRKKYVKGHQDREDGVKGNCGLGARILHELRGLVVGN